MINSCSRSKEMFQFSTYIMSLDEIPHHKHTNYEGIVALQINLLHITLMKKNLKACVQSFWFFHQMIAVKFRLSPFKKICVICFIESSLKLMANAFYFILKLFSFSRYLSFYLCLRFWSCRKSVLINCKTHDVTTWLSNNCIKHVAQHLTK